MPMSFDLLGFANHLSHLHVAVMAEQERAMHKAGELVEKEAKAEIGHYQSAARPFEAWTPLAVSTLADKGQLGYSPPDNPLLREGDLRDSIGHKVEMQLGYGEIECVIGSNSQVAVWQELGTSKMPPRSFLGGAAVRKSHEVAEEIGRYSIVALCGGESNVRIP